MRTSYVKPEIMQEVQLRRDLVYAQAEDERQGCTTLTKKIDQDKDSSFV